MSLTASGLERNRSLLHLGLQDNGVTCSGVIALAEALTNGVQLRRVDLRKNKFELAGLMALAAALKHTRTLTRLDLDVEAPPQHAEEYDRLTRDISELCAANLSALEQVASEQPAETVDAAQAARNDFSRKISLTCPLPATNDRILLSLTEEEEEEDETGKRVSRKLRSPLPSPSFSPSPSPVPSPSGRFKVSNS